jgi:AraC-like DNA-binding protein
MKKSSLFLAWPLRHLPDTTVTRGGTFPMLVPGCNQTYLHPTTALHLHDYAGDFWVGGHRYRLEPGDITFSPGGRVPTRYELKEGGSHLCIHFERSASPRRAAECIRLPFHLRLGPQTAAARERFWRVIDHLRLAGGRHRSPAAAAGAAALQEMLLWLHLQSRRDAGPRAGSLAEEALEKLSKAIDASLATPMLLGDLAAGVGLSTDYVARLFARRYGMTLQHYILLRRIELARHLLISSDLKVAEIGRRSGLPDPQYFNKQFRRVVGLSPLAYRRQKRG